MKTSNTRARLVLGLFLFAMLALPFSTSFLASKRTSAAELDGHLGLMPDDCLPKDPPPPVVKLKVRVPACSAPGSPLVYRICVENCSSSEAHHVTVKNALPSNAKFVKADPAPSKEGPELQWNLGTIGAGGVREIILTLQPTNKEDVKNCVRVVYEHGLCLVTRQAGFGPGKPPVITPVPEEGLPVLDLSVRSANLEKQFVNLPNKYDITVTNKGKARATNLQVSVKVPGKLKIDAVSAPGIKADQGEDIAAWNLGTLEAGASRNVQVTLRAKDSGEHCFKVKAVADHDVKKEIEVCTKFVGVSAMSIEMYDRDGTDPAFVGEKVSYLIFIRSTGSEPVTNVRVKAFIPDALKLEKTIPPMIEKREPAEKGEYIYFRTLPQIEAGARARYEVFVEAMKRGVTYFRTDITADQLDPGRPVIEEESTTVEDDRAPPLLRKLSRTKAGR
jgi:uncharacterized repeat protein (TIGR01451 family)